MKFNFILLVYIMGLTFLLSAEDKTITVDGTIREYIIEVPADYDRSIPYDPVTVYHGMGGTAANITRLPCA